MARKSRVIGDTQEFGFFAVAIELVAGQKSASRRSLEDPEDLPEARFWTATRSL